MIRRVWLLAGLAAFGAGICVAVVTARAPGIRVQVSGRWIRLPERTTLAEAAHRLGLRPRVGSLLDVEGHVLRVGSYPGALLVDGRPAAGATPLRSGETVGVRDGRDRSEPRRRTVTRTSVARRADPQFFVDLVPGRLVVVSGAISHKLVSARFVPEGGPLAERSVALTFDDGPSPYTPSIVAALRRLHAPATFFVIGLQAAAYPQLVRLEQRSGMVVANHSWDHPNSPPFAQLPHGRIRMEIRRNQAELAGLGVRSSLFRPPGGSVSPFVLRAAAAAGARVVLWSVDPRDWVRGTTARQIVRRVLGALRAGSIVDLHDGGGNRLATLRALPAIVKGIRRRGLSLVALGGTG